MDRCELMSKWPPYLSLIPVGFESIIDDLSFWRATTTIGCSAAIPWMVNISTLILMYNLLDPFPPCVCKEKKKHLILKLSENIWMQASISNREIFELRPKELASEQCFAGVIYLNCFIAFAECNLMWDYIVSQFASSSMKWTSWRPGTRTRPPTSSGVTRPCSTRKSLSSGIIRCGARPACQVSTPRGHSSELRE